jgi:cellulose synthase/poly-beta-1,6-N-acetylglucosamine synthase-like glycosyltransferase
MIWVFAVCVAFVFYAYIGYPCAMWMLAQRKQARSPQQLPASDLPDIAIVLAVHNDCDRLRAKIANLHNLQYGGRKRVIVVSDGSTDGTAEAASAARDVEAVILTARSGKASALNAAMTLVHESIVVLTDVRQELSHDSLERLVEHFQDPRVGAVSGLLVHRDPASPQSASIGLYWKYERWIRASQSKLDSTIGATGAFYALRRQLWTDLPRETLIDDFVVPMRIVRQGYSVKLDDRAVALDDLERSTSGEFRRKVRTLMGNFQVMATERWLFSTENRLRAEWLSHKVSRLLAPYCLIAILVSSYFLPAPFGPVVFWGQVLFYAAGTIGHFFPRVANIRGLGFATTFVMLNAAAIVALWRFMTTKVDGRWAHT